ncbi:MAG: xanthine dehydrogenase family protein [Firmicutes bacterium]|nr:xanthine dehydrogenase family protein [Bacillota bacterium]
MPGIIGTAMKRVDAPAKARGQALYAGDYTNEKMLYACLVRAEYAHARIIDIDVSQIPEGTYCFTAKDLVCNRIPFIFDDQPALADEKVRFYGEPIAVVAADTLEAARKAAQKVHVTYQQLPAILDGEKALDADAPKVHEQGNICGEFHRGKGDTEAAFEKCALILEDVFEVLPQEHAYLEPEVAYTYIDEKGRLCLYSSTQNAFLDRTTLCQVLGLEVEQVVSRAATVGGGFGGKDGHTIQVFPALVTQKTGRPCRMTYTRKENLQATFKRHAAKAYAKMGFDQNGKILAFEGKIIFDTGAYAAYGPSVLSLGSEHLAGPYNIENTKIDGYLSYTNNTPASAMRGFGAPQGCFGTEVFMGKAAALLGLDPIEIRRRNVLREGDLGAIGQKMDHSIGLLEALNQFEQSEFWRKAKADKSGTYGYGIAAGFLSSGFGKGVNDQATITIEKTEDGYTVYCGLVDIGQGSETALIMITAEALEVPVEKVKMVMADTELTQDCSSTAASRSVYIGGNAILDAVKEIKKGAVKATGHAVFPENQLDSFGVHTLYGFIVQGAKVRIDPISGAVNVLEVHNVTEAGRIMNPVSVAGQMYGGIVMSTGYAISEGIHYQNGVALEDSFASYVIPTAMDAPRMSSENIEAYEPTGPYGVKGIAEAPTVAVAAAIANAVADVVPEAHIHTLPIDRVEILRNFPKKESKAGDR